MEGMVVILFYAAAGVVVLIAGALFYARSVKSRKRYCCPKCGERVAVELMEASRCNMCGAPLREPMTKEVR